MNELMITGWLPEVGEMGMPLAGKRYRSCVRSEIGRRDLGGRDGLGGRLRGRRVLRRKGEVSARATERSVRTVRVREGGGTCRSRVREERHERSGAVRAVGGGRQGGPEIGPRSRAQGMVYFMYSGQPTL